MKVGDKNVKTQANQRSGVRMNVATIRTRLEPSHQIIKLGFGYLFDSLKKNLGKSLKKQKPWLRSKRLYLKTSRWSNPGPNLIIKKNRDGSKKVTELKTIVGWAGLGCSTYRIGQSRVDVGYNNLTHAHTYLLFRVLPRKQVTFFFVVYIQINPRTISFSSCVYFRVLLARCRRLSSDLLPWGGVCLYVLEISQTSSLLSHVMLWFLMSEMVPVFCFR